MNFIKILTLLDMSDIPNTVEEDKWWQTIPFDIGGGWTAHVFYDGNELDYVELVEHTDGTKFDPFKEKTLGAYMIRTWRGVGDGFRLLHTKDLHETELYVMEQNANA